MKNLILIFSVLFCSHSFAESIWFCPIDTDFLNHSNLDKEWTTSAKKINVFKFYSGVVHDAPDASLKLKISKLKALNIDSSIEVPVLSWDGKTKKTEGFESPGYLKDILKKFKRNGGELKYISMDEPLYYGLYNNKKSDMSSFINNLKNTMSIVWDIYPNAEVVDIEPLSQFRGDYLQKNYSVWVNAFKEATGHPISAMHADLYWEGDYKHDITSIEPILKREDIKLGVIFNADKNNSNNKSWVQTAKENVMNYYKYVGVKPEDIIFQSWSHYPNKIIPDSSSDSHLNIIKNFKN